MKLFVNILLLLIIVAGSIGIPVFQHTCAQSNVVAKTIFISPDNCHEKKDIHPVHSCCKKKETKVKHDCCNDKVSSYKVGFFKGHSDHFQFVICQTISAPQPVYHVETTFAEVNNLVLGFADLPPPKLTDRLALLQVWRI